MTCQYEKIFHHVLPALETKMSEFRYYQYNAITVDDLWHYCVRKKWRKKQLEQVRLHEMIATIMNVSPSEIVSYSQIHALQSVDWFSNSQQEELQFLLHPKRKS